MADGETDDEYAFVQKALHWLVALLVFAQVGLGLWVASLGPQDQALAAKLYQAHDGTGATILALVLIRLAFRIILDVPLLPRGTPGWINFLSGLNHRLLYLVLIVQPILGYLVNGANGYPWSIYGYYDVPAIIGKNEALAKILGEAHETGAWVLLALVALHITGVLFHAVVRRDGVARRMA